MIVDEFRDALMKNFMNYTTQIVSVTTQFVGQICTIKWSSKVKLDIGICPFCK